MIQGRTTKHRAMAKLMTQPPAIRAAKESDVAELARLFTSLGFPVAVDDLKSRWEHWQAAGKVALVAENSDGTLAGVATLHQMEVLHRPRPVGRISTLVVDESLRGQGVGRALVEAAEVLLTEAGCGLMEITCNLRREGSHAFYEHLSYGRTSVRFAKVLRAMDT
jgi:GNAT superfamily N-acetyltransferase